MASSLEIARSYIGRGWQPLPIPHREKAPVITGWQKLRITSETASSYFDGSQQNVGIILGEASGGLTDVDLDCREALQIADRFLPRTECIFGRASKPLSHRLYVTQLAQTVRYHDPTNNKVLLELRAVGQTVFPGSTHTSGERVEWNSNGDPCRVDGDKLRRRTAALAACALVARYWPAEGGRHQLALVLGGFLARLDWKADGVEIFVEEAAKCAGDEEVRNRVITARGAVALRDQGKNVPGLPQLRKAVGEAVADRVAEWLGSKRTPAEREGEQPILTCLADVKPEPIEWLWPDRIALGKLSLLVGHPGLGKSQCSIDAAARVTTGREWPRSEGRAHSATLLFSVLRTTWPTRLGHASRPPGARFAERTF